MTTEELKERTKQCAVRGIRLVVALPKNTVGEVLGGQFLKACTSVKEANELTAIFAAIARTTKQNSALNSYLVPRTS